MSEKTGIAWTDATWGPVVGCSRVSRGCEHCYAETMAHRLAAHPNQKVSGVYGGLTVMRGGNPTWSNVVRCLPERLDIPLRWKTPRRVFVNSMSDLFHPDVPDEFVDQVFAVMALANQHTFQVLTKRPERMRDYMRRLTPKKIAEAGFRIAGRPACNALQDAMDGIGGPQGWPLPNVWLGTSVEDQKTADERIPALLQCNAAVRWISAEPLLGPIRFRWTPYAHQATGESYREYLERKGSINEYEALRQLSWVVTGGESGPDARPAHPDWFRTLRDECKEAGVAFFFKQWGGARAGTGGHLLDGVEHKEYPK